MTNMTNTTIKVEKDTIKAEEVNVIASRKSCLADGVGLSHYIMMDRKVSK